MYEDLEPIANLKFGEIVEHAAKGLPQRLQGLGLGRSPISGQVEAARMDARIDAAEGNCRGLYRIWLDLILKRNAGQLTREDINFIMSKVQNCATSALDSLTAVREPLSDQLVGLKSSLEQRARRRIDSWVSGVSRELEIRIREQDAFRHAAGKNVAGQAATDEVFTIAAASNDMRPLLEHVIEPAIDDNGLRQYLMVVREPETGSINNAILTHIESAKLVVADLTHERPNCYYEVGYAHAKGKRVVLLARKDHDSRRPGRELADPQGAFRFG